MEDYTVPDIGRTGYAAAEPGGVALYTTLDGGATWQPLDLTALESQLPASRTGIHTCSLRPDPETPGCVWVHCAPNGSNSLENDFGICTADYGETWQLRAWDPQVWAVQPLSNGGEEP